jgi:hypothetical protein
VFNVVAKMNVGLCKLKIQNYCSVNCELLGESGFGLFNLPRCLCEITQVATKILFCY